MKVSKADHLREVYGGTADVEGVKTQSKIGPVNAFTNIPDVFPGVSG